MTDDIVTRLRKAVAQAVEADTEPFPDFSKLLWEAADEIERLRAMCEKFANCAKECGTKYGSDVVAFHINNKKFRKIWHKYKRGAW